MPKQAPEKAAVPSVGPLPPWAEHDVTFEKLSDHQQHEVRQIVSPLYQRLVLQPHDPLERSCGVSVIHLIWSELLKQCELASLRLLKYRILRNPSRPTIFRTVRSPERQMPTLLAPHSDYASTHWNLQHSPTPPPQPCFPLDSIPLPPAVSEMHQ